MSNLIYIKKDPILIELDNSVDKQSTKKMLAFKYFNNNVNLLDEYLDKNNKKKSDVIDRKNFKSISQLEFSF
jgi:hypothetical protein|tara:strand:+ start:274 stop:489 length:216 start_codon:yes stop_codon:yes gene_type:complete